MSFEWYDPVFITHDPKLIGLTENILFGLHDSCLVILLLKKMSDEEGKWKHISLVFKTHHPWLSGNLVNKLSQWAPSPMHCPIHLRLVMTVRVSPVTLHFSENFLLKIFPFLTSVFSLPSLNLFSFSLPSSSPTS